MVYATRPVLPTRAASSSSGFEQLVDAWRLPVIVTTWPVRNIEVPAGRR